MDQVTAVRKVDGLVELWDSSLVAKKVDKLDDAEVVKMVALRAEKLVVAMVVQKEYAMEKKWDLKQAETRDKKKASAMAVLTVFLQVDAKVCKREAPKVASMGL